MTTQANDYEDFTGRMCDLRDNLEPKQWGSENQYWDNDIPMYSFRRAAHAYWNGVANYLRDSGCDDEEIRVVMGHKYMRWMLDHGPLCDTDISELGYRSADKYFQGAKPDETR